MQFTSRAARLDRAAGGAGHGLVHHGAQRTAIRLSLAPVLVVAMNALMALPFVLSILAPAIERSRPPQHDRLCASLGLSGFARLRLIDLPVLEAPARPCRGDGLRTVARRSHRDLAVRLAGSHHAPRAHLSRRWGATGSTTAAGTALVLAVFSIGDHHADRPRSAAMITLDHVTFRYEDMDGVTSISPSAAASFSPSSGPAVRASRPCSS